jgi:hypothetical protein
LSQKPRTFDQRRLRALLCLLDTGLWVDEALTLRRHDVDCDTPW